LEERLASPRLESLSQRITNRSYLEALRREETADYIRRQVSWAGGDPEALFAPDAFDAVFKATDGVPRLINQVCDHALLLAFAGGARRIGAAGIEESWADLQQLPAPWTHSSKKVRRVDPAVIEFGVLDDADEPSVESPPPKLSVVGLGLSGDPFETADRIEEQLREIDGPSHPADTVPPAIPEARPIPAGRPDTRTMPLSAYGVPSESDWHYAPAAPNPFAEPFQHEEVIIDRYASMEAGQPRPVVTSREAAWLGPLLESAARPVQPASPAAPASKPVTPGGVERVHKPAPETVTGASEKPWVIVDDEPSASPPPRPAVRKEDYRRLFARLRRG
jgi:hypothetical protein